VAWEYAESTIDVIQNLQKEGVYVAAVEQTELSVPLQNFIVTKGQTYAVVFGNEVKGVQQEVVSKSNGVIEIPQYGTKHSLNISVSAGVVLWDLFSKLKKLS